MDTKKVSLLPVMVMLLVDIVLGEKDVGKWSEWTNWSGCSQSCGSGITTRTRHWQTPPGQATLDEPFRFYENSVCNDGRCPVDGSWANWGRWSRCTEACGGGTATRKRMCNSAMFGGKPCEGESYEEEECNRVPCPPLPVRFNMSTCTRKNSFICESKRMCIPIKELCDETVQCHDGSDEKQCYGDSKGKGKGSVRYSFVRDTGAESRASLSIITSLVVMVIMTRVVG